MLLEHIPLWTLGPVLLIGLLAGTLGGLLGVGGSVIMIPGLVFLYGQGVTEGFNQHVYQAAAMIANVVVALAATLRHRRANALVPQVLRDMLPAAVLAILVGVWLSNLPVFHGSEGAVWLARILALFLVYEAFLNLQRIRGGEHHTLPNDQNPHITRPRSGAVGVAMGLIGGLLGVGGGILAVPLQQRLLHLPMRAAIANSSAVMVASAAIGACYKNATLSQHHLPWTGAVLLAVLLAPTCMLGANLGAMLTHRLPLRQVRVVFVILMILAAYRLADLPWPG